MKKYLIIGWMAFILEVASTMYISTVSEKSVFMIFWAFIGPFLTLPFVGYMVESKTWTERIKTTPAYAIAMAMALG